MKRVSTVVRLVWYFRIPKLQCKKKYKNIVVTKYVVEKKNIIEGIYQNQTLMFEHSTTIRHQVLYVLR